MSSYDEVYQIAAAELKSVLDDLHAALADEYPVIHLLVPEVELQDTGPAWCQLSRLVVELGKIHNGYRHSYQAGIDYRRYYIKDKPMRLTRALCKVTWEEGNTYFGRGGLFTGYLNQTESEGDI